MKTNDSISKVGKEICKVWERSKLWGSEGL